MSESQLNVQKNDLAAFFFSSTPRSTDPSPHMCCLVPVFGPPGTKPALWMPTRDAGRVKCMSICGRHLPVRSTARLHGGKASSIFKISLASLPAWESPVSFCDLAMVSGIAGCDLLLAGSAESLFGIGNLDCGSGCGGAFSRIPSGGVKNAASSAGLACGAFHSSRGKVAHCVSGPLTEDLPLVGGALYFALYSAAGGAFHTGAATGVGAATGGAAYTGVAATGLAAYTGAAAIGAGAAYTGTAAGDA